MMVAPVSGWLLLPANDAEEEADEDEKQKARQGQADDDL